MSEVSELNQVKRPDSRALIHAINEIIHEMAEGTMTPVEALGCLDVVSKSFYERNLAPSERG